MFTILLHNSKISRGGSAVNGPSPSNVTPFTNAMSRGTLNVTPFRNATSRGALAFVALNVTDLEGRGSYKLPTQRGHTLFQTRYNQRGVRLEAEGLYQE